MINNIDLSDSTLHLAHFWKNKISNHPYFSIIKKYPHRLIISSDIVISELKPELISNEKIEEKAIPATNLKLQISCKQEQSSIINLLLERIIFLTYSQEGLDEGHKESTQVDQDLLSLIKILSKAEEQEFSLPNKQVLSIYSLPQQLTFTLLYSLKDYIPFTRFEVYIEGPNKDLESFAQFAHPSEFNTEFEISSPTEVSTCMHAQKIIMMPNQIFYPLIHHNYSIGAIRIELNSSLNKRQLEILHKYTALVVKSVFYQNLHDKKNITLSRVEQLNRYVSKNIISAIENIESNNLSNYSNSSYKHVVVLFADIRSFTSISEKLSPENLIYLLNFYYQQLIPVVEKYGGTIDKLVGDMIAVFWNAPLDIPNPELMAIKAAQEMQKAMILKVTSEWKKFGIDRVGIGIGVHHGEAFVGNIGTAKIKHYTVFGEVVDFAVKLESLARPGEIMISESMAKLLEGKIPRFHRVEKNISGKNSGLVLRPLDYPDY